VNRELEPREMASGFARRRIHHETGRGNAGSVNLANGVFIVPLAGNVPKLLLL